MTNRESEVLRVVAQQLVIGPRTVNAHLTSIYNKLGVNSRVTVTWFALDRASCKIQFSSRLHAQRGLKVIAADHFVDLTYRID